MYLAACLCAIVKLYLIMKLVQLFWDSGICGQRSLRPSSKSTPDKLVWCD